MAILCMQCPCFVHVSMCGVQSLRCGGKGPVTFDQFGDCIARAGGGGGRIVWAYVPLTREIVLPAGWGRWPLGYGCVHLSCWAFSPVSQPLGLQWALCCKTPLKPLHFHVSPRSFGRTPHTAHCVLSVYSLSCAHWHTAMPTGMAVAMTSDFAHSHYASSYPFPHGFVGQAQHRTAVFSRVPFVRGLRLGLDPKKPSIQVSPKSKRGASEVAQKTVHEARLPPTSCRNRRGDHLSPCMQSDGVRLGHAEVL